MMHRKFLVFVLLFVFIVVGFLVYSNLNTVRKSDELVSVEKMVSGLQLQTGNEESRFSHDRDVVLGKPVYTEVNVKYKPVNSNTKKDLYTEIVENLKKDGWDGEECDGCSPDYYKAYLERGPKLFIASVLIHPDEDFVTLNITVRSRP